MPYNDFDNQEKHTLDEIEQMEQEELAAKKKRFNPFARSEKETEGVSKEEEQIWEYPTLKNFFKFVGRKLNPILSVNLMMIFGNFMAKQAAYSGFVWMAAWLYRGDRRR